MLNSIKKFFESEEEKALRAQIEAERSDHMTLARRLFFSRESHDEAAIMKLAWQSCFTRDRHINALMISEQRHHEGKVRALAVLPSGVLASGAFDNNVQLSYLSNGSLLTTLSGHKQGIRCLAVLPDGNFVSGAEDSTIRLWDVSSGYGYSKATLSGHTKSVKSLAVMPDGLLASGGGDSKILLWDLSNRSQVGMLSGHTRSVLSLAALTGGLLASGGADQKIVIWQVATRSQRMTFEGHTKGVASLAALTGDRLASGGEDSTIFLWHLSGGARHRLTGHNGTVISLAALPQNLLASGSDDRNIRLWSISQKSCVAVFSAHRSGVTCLAVLPNGLLASGSYDKTIRVWYVGMKMSVDKAQEQIEQKERENQELESRKAAQREKEREGREQWQNGHSERVTTYHAWQLRWEAFMAEWQTYESIKPHELVKLSEHGGQLTDFKVLSNDRLVSASCDGTIKVWQIALGRCVSTLSGHSGEVCSLQVLSNGDLASGGRHGEIKLWNLDAAECTSTLTGHRGEINALVALPDNRLASAGSDKRIKIWNLSTGTGELTLLGHSEKISALVVLPDGHLASASSDHTIKLWDLDKRECVLTLSDHRGPICALILLPDGRLASGSRDMTIKLWDLASATCEMTLSMSNLALCFAVLPNGHLAVGCMDKAIRFLDAKDGREIASIPQCKGEIHALGISPNGSLVFGSGADINLWDLGIRRVNPSTKNDVASLFTIPEMMSAQEDNQGELVNAGVESIADDIELGLQVSHADLRLGAKLGEGGFGVVYRGTWQSVDVAIKQLKVTRLSERATADFKQEAKKHASLRHANIVALFGICLDPGQYSLIMEFMPKGSLYDVLHDEGETLEWGLRYAIAHQVAAGLSYLHMKNILHRDMKSLNVLMGADMTAKLSDFGLSKEVKQESNTATAAQAVGSVLWMAPELFQRGAKHSEASDIYALGVIFWEIASRKLPFQGEENATDINVRAWVRDGERETVPEDSPPEFGALIRRCWAQRVEDRPQKAVLIASELSGSEEPEQSVVKNSVLSESGYAMWSEAQANNKDSSESSYAMWSAAPSGNKVAPESSYDMWSHK